MKLSTKNIEKAIKAIDSKYIRKTIDCSGCNKRIQSNEAFHVGVFKSYHGDCLLKNIDEIIQAPTTDIRPST